MVCADLDERESLGGRNGAAVGVRPTGEPMTNLSVATRVDPLSAAVATRRAPARDVFLPAGSSQPTSWGRVWRRLHWPLGVYTTPVLILLAWEVLGATGILPALYAPAPSEIASTAVQLWRDGVLGPDLAISLQRAGLGLALGLSVGIVTGVLGGFLRRGEYLFNGLAQILNTIPLLAVLPLMIVWFGIDELTKVLLIASARAYRCTSISSPPFAGSTTG
jgi:sulfonate transport system permease protein